ncbi:uncharacterized protein TNCV_3280061 [Trichonephila clavipes]|nr:uncharacterized protein TNCV_3280061 [Trichonephila clavipes]
MQIIILPGVLFIGYKHSLNNARSIAFYQRTSSTHLLEDETSNGSDIINNLIDYEDGEEEPDSSRRDKIYAGIQHPYKFEKHFLKSFDGQHTSFVKTDRCIDASVSEICFSGGTERYLTGAD